MKLAVAKNSVKFISIALMVVAGAQGAYASSKFSTEADELSSRNKIDFYTGVAAETPIMAGYSQGNGPASNSSLDDAAQSAVQVINEEAEQARDEAWAMEQRMQIKMSALEKRLAGAGEPAGGSVETKDIIVNSNYVDMFASKQMGSVTTYRHCWGKDNRNCEYRTDTGSICKFHTKKTFRVLTTDGKEVDRREISSRIVMERKVNYNRQDTGWLLYRAGYSNKTSQRREC
ncbi:hypothetical protein [Marinobacter sp. ELB17]|uniref:hypothetical protein n=1 Tax=Marinobacter sp. ELB17 TaxID=270374 RepID=UPI0000F3834C|nr:hypothetical protein [Marinobacter sp. ELB17]EAZ98148.1 hypothetical protein MELB17_09698 [Marinobacter sp. ELB17]